MKRLIRIGVVVFIVVLVIGITAITTNNESGKTPVKNSELIEVPVDSVTHLFEVLDNNSEYDIVLTDLLTGNDLGGVTLEEGISVFSVLNFENGYSGALVGVEHPFFLEGWDDIDWDDEDWDDEDWDDEDWDDEDWDDEDWDDEDWDDEDWDDEDWDDGDWDDEDWDDEDWDDEDWDDEDWDDEDWDDEDWGDESDILWDDEFFEEHDEDLRYLILDSQLNIVHDILITDPYLLSSWDHFVTHVTYDNDELIVYYVPDLFHLSDEEPQSIRRYNATTGKTVEIAIFEDADLFIENIVVINEDTIAFAAMNIEESESDFYYGTIETASGNITLLTEDEFLYSGLTVASHYVLLNEEILTPLEMDDDDDADDYDDDDADDDDAEDDDDADDDDDDDDDADDDDADDDDADDYDDDDADDDDAEDDDDADADDADDDDADDDDTDDADDEETPEQGNRALLLNTETNESREVQLGEMESMWARLSRDANSIVTVNSDVTSFRQYDITNGEMVSEVKFELDHGEQQPWAVEIFAITDSTYVVHFVSELGIRTAELVELP